MHNYTRRNVARGLVVVALTGLTACGDSPVGAPSFAPLPCEVPATPVLKATLDGIGRTDLRIAVQDAATRVAASLPAAANADELRVALTRLDRNLEGAQSDAACRMVHLAMDALDQQPLDDATLPDRAALQLVLEMTSAALTDAVMEHRSRYVMTAE